MSRSMRCPHCEKHTGWPVFGEMCWSRPSRVPRRYERISKNPLDATTNRKYIIDMTQENETAKLHCCRCHHEWDRRVASPTVCPQCNSPYWSERYRNIPMGEIAQVLACAACRGLYPELEGTSNREKGTK